MNYFLIITTILLLSDACEQQYSRTIKNNTKYGVEIINYANVPPIGSDTFTYIDPYSEFSAASQGGSVPFGFFQTPAFTPELTDSLVINFYQEGSDTIYRKRFVQYDTTLLFRCLTGSEPPTCLIEGQHLEGAKLVIK